MAMPKPEQKIAVDWTSLALEMGTITYTDGGRSESGGFSLAREALERILPSVLFESAVDHYVHGLEGFELARSVLRLLRNQVSHDRCLYWIHADKATTIRRTAVELFRGLATLDSMSTLLDLLDDPDTEIQIWAALGIDEVERCFDVEDEMVSEIIRRVSAHGNKTVRDVAQTIADRRRDDRAG